MRKREQEKRKRRMRKRNSQRRTRRPETHWMFRDAEEKKSKTNQKTRDPLDVSKFLQSVIVPYALSLQATSSSPFSRLVRGALHLCSPRLLPLSSLIPPELKQPGPTKDNMFSCSLVWLNRDAPGVPAAGACLRICR